jgi:NitT/TauT family transport system permease protein
MPFRPNSEVPPMTARAILVAWAVIGLLVWSFGPAVIPTPLEVLRAFPPLFSNGLLEGLLSSLTLNIEALLLSSILSLGLAYLTVLGALRPFVTFVAKLRFLGLTGLTFVFGLMLTGHSLKVGLLVLGLTVFMTTTMVDVVATIPKWQFEHARTLRMTEWRVVWEVVILGTFDKALEALRQNAAIGWVMLTMVEGLVRSEGGLGTLLLNENKHFKLDAVFAVQIVILGVGLLQDYGLGKLRQVLCPYADIGVERR